MYKAMFEPDLTRPFDNLTIMRSSDVNRVNKQEVYGGADVKADRVFEINPNHAVFGKIEELTIKVNPKYTKNFIELFKDTYNIINVTDL